MAKITNFLKILGSFTFFSKYTSIVYENKSINVFGILEYVPDYGGHWFISKPLSLSKNNASKLISQFKEEQYHCYGAIILRSVFVYCAVKGLLWAAKRI